MTSSEIVEKYHTVPLKFYSYYKYVFLYKGVAPDGNIIHLLLGGDASDIYSWTILRDEVEYIDDDCNVKIYNPANELIAEIKQQ